MNCKIELDIKSLGSIKNSKVEFKPFLLFYGEPSTGKSYLALAFYKLMQILTDRIYIKNILEIIKEPSISKNLSREELEEEFRNCGFDVKYINEKTHLDSFEKDSSKINFKIREFKVKDLISNIENSYKENINRFFQELIKYPFNDIDLNLNITGDYENLILKIYESDKKIIFFSSLFNKVDENYIRTNLLTHLPGFIDIEIIISDIIKKIIFNDSINLYFSYYYLPPAKNALINMRDFALRASLEDLPLLGVHKEFYKKILARLYDNESQNFSKIKKDYFDKLINGSFVTRPDGSIVFKFVKNGENVEIPYSSASTSIQELAPLYYVLQSSNLNNISITYEEPEAHLHPKLQRQLGLLLSYLVNQGGFLQITTHSDYLTNRLNNLIKLHNIKLKDENLFKKALEELNIPEESVLNPEKVGAYYFEKKGNGNTFVRNLKIEDYGIPMESFENDLIDMTKETNYLMDLLEE